MLGMALAPLFYYLVSACLFSDWREQSRCDHRKVTQIRSFCSLPELSRLAALWEEKRASREIEFLCDNLNSSCQRSTLHLKKSKSQMEI